VTDRRPAAIRKRLLSWFDSEKRSLPWRGTRDPYRIWVSEVMLQQTTVGAVAARYERFLERFPDLKSLARAREESVLAAWSGLGYYARARHLRAAARRIAAEHDGRVPRDPETLRALPGFGEYMSAAVASLAYGVRIPAVDANVGRVVSRLFAVEGTLGTRAHAEEIRRRVQALLPDERPGDLTAVLMDLGQQICRPRLPECPRCPVARLCEGLASGRPERFPRRRPKPRSRRVAVAAAVARRDGQVLLERANGSRLGGMFLFPAAEAMTPGAARARLGRRLRAIGLRLGDGPLGETRHTIMNRLLEICVYGAVSNGGANPDGARWLSPAELARAPLPTLTRKIAAAANLAVPRWPLRR
jgi:A/G-specific adenine glycosylase